MQLAKVLQPRHFDAFRCIGADCEDTCCAGWQVHVDKLTYEKYQSCSDPECGGSLRTLVTINETSSNDDDYAKVVLSGAECPFLSEGLCSIQKRLGEAYLPNMCATYPRAMNLVGDVLQRSLDLSCPEAARVALLNPTPMEFVEQDYQPGSIRLANFPSLDISSLNNSASPYGFFRDVRRLVLSLLQNRSYPIWKRLVMVGCLGERLANGRNAVSEAEEYVNRRFDDGPYECSAHSTTQLAMVLDLIVARISTDSNPRSFLNCYKQFIEGLQWTSESTSAQLGARYREVCDRYYIPVMSQYPQILEHYLVNYVYRTLFPFGLPELNRKLANDRVSSPIAAQYMLMIAYFAILQTLLIGMAGFHQEAFGPDQIISLIQSGTKTFQHSLAYPGRVIQILADNTMTTPATLCVLIRN
jgi:lysine-N-methylase